MRCVFVVQASKNMGTGHLMRCLALAQVFDNHDIESTFLLDEASLASAKQRHDWTGRIVAHHYAADLADRSVDVKRAARQCGSLPDWVIVDGYQFDAEYCGAWRALGCRVALFDDGVHDARALESADCVLAGTDYRLLRREFWSIMPLPVTQRHSLTLSFGGSDPANITQPLLLALERLNFSGPVRVVTGQAYADPQRIGRFVGQSSLTIQHIHAAQDMADVWSNARLAVSAAGGSQFELAVCETPSILVVVADNQRAATEQAVAEGWCESILLTHATSEHSGGASQNDIDAIAQRILALWEDETALLTMQQAIVGRYTADGGERIIDALLQAERADG
ncbi:PseG/SpsG family protein [Alteromonas oceanisediminis]|uniref:PseG/SpsG family protein n=1 Tax=Alteromonas oceanisediminis TaxID=2836180 RepID=UPI001BDAF571|nr:glycosyltransferase [Alteromonas oceanisediminis]MBT0584949.1 hypothetical protein [Alteromonas oceanisediminis]